MKTFENNIKVNVNNSKKTFTIRINGVKYRTNKMIKELFDECIYNTSKDWLKYLQTSFDYYKVK